MRTCALRLLPLVHASIVPYQYVAGVLTVFEVTSRSFLFADKIWSFTASNSFRIPCSARTRSEEGMSCEASKAAFAALAISTACESDDI